MGEHGCFKSGKMDEDSKALGRELKGKSLAEKLEFLKTHNYGFDWKPYLNDKGELVNIFCTTVLKSDDEDGMFLAPLPLCACPPIREAKEPIWVSNVYCCCCAGHTKHHFQNILGVKLRLKSVGTIPNENNELYSRIFTYEIIN